MVYGVCHEGTTREQANQALSRFKDDFFDWNEVRVSSLDEIQSALAGLPDAEPRAQRIRRFLRQLFEKTYGFTLDALTKKPLKESLKSLQEYEAFGSDYVEATVILPGPRAATPSPSTRPPAAPWSGSASPTPETDNAALRSLSNAPCPRTAAPSSSTSSKTWPTTPASRAMPDCPRCELRKICPTGLSTLADAHAVARQAAANARSAAKTKDLPRPKEKEADTVKPVAKPPEKSHSAPAAQVPQPKELPKATKPTKGRPGGTAK